MKLKTGIDGLEASTQLATDLDLNKAHNIFLFRLNEQTFQRGLRIVKMEGTGHPLEWLPSQISREGIQLLKRKGS